MGPKKVFLSLLEQAERRFGDRSRKLRIKINGRDHDIPETVPDGDDGCCVYYYRNARRDMQRLRFQLSHEAIHVLSGAFNREALIFEEGLATSFSLDIFHDDKLYQDRARASLPQLFYDALQLFGQLAPTDESIRNLRANCSCLDKITPDLLTQEFHCPNELAMKLCMRVPADMHLRRA